MTIKECSSPSNQFQIYFWDTMIWTMSTLQQIRYRYFKMTHDENTQPKIIKILITSLVWLALGLYLGVILGFFGI